MFIFSVSHNTFIPVPLMLLSFHLLKTEKKSGLLMDTICVLFLLCSHLRLSFVSVVLVFNASFNDVAPISPMLLPIM